MKRFILNISAFSIISLLLYVSFYWSYLELTLPRTKNAAYTWGDSQMYQDLDLDYLNANTAYHFYSAAMHGAGLYDFLVFTNSVPENADVIIEISHTALLRRKMVDLNTSALNIDALGQLKQNGYSFTELLKVVKNNIVPQKLFSDKNILFPAKDTIIMTDPIDLFTTAYAQKPDYFYDKENLYFYGIKNLLKKHCKIIALIFPNHSILNKIENASPYAQDIMQFDNQVGAFFPRKDTIEISSQENIFYDLTHLNTRGAGYLSKEMTSRINFNNAPLLIMVKQADQTNK